MKKIIFALSSVFFTSSALAATHWYDKSSRTISVTFEQPVEQVKVFLSGYNMMGQCARDMSVMKFVPSKNHNKSNSFNHNTNGSVGYRGTAQLGTGYNSTHSHSTQYTEPQKYEHNYTGLLRQLHYTIVYRRNGRDIQLDGGWSGNDFPCNYQVPLN